MYISVARDEGMKNTMWDVEYSVIRLDAIDILLTPAFMILWPAIYIDSMMILALYHELWAPCVFDTYFAKLF